MEWSLNNPKIKMALIGIGVIVFVYWALATWANRVHSAEKRVYRAWGLYAESLHHRIALLPSLSQLIQFYAPQAQDILQGANQAYTDITSVPLSESILTDPSAEQQFRNAELALENSFVQIDKRASRYSALAQNHQY